MLIQSISLLLASTVTLALSQSDCSPKFVSAENGHSCEYFVGKPDTFRIFASINFSSPLPSEKKPEIMQKLRMWTDSVFNNFDIRYPDTKARVLPPPDSLLGWSYGHLLFEKSTLLALAEADFVRRIDYFETPPQTEINCSSKFLSAENGHTCKYFVGKPDTLRIFSSILFTRPMPGEEKTPENMQKLRKWTDSVFNNHDIRYPYSREVRALPPPDSQLSWVSTFLLIEKSSLLALAEESFIGQIEYYENGVYTAILRPRHPMAIRPERGRYYDANGRLTAPWRSDVAEKPGGIRVRFRHR